MPGESNIFCSAIGRQVASLGEISVATLLPADTAQHILQHLTGGGQVSALEAEYFIHARNYQACYDAVRARVFQAGQSGADELAVCGARNCAANCNYPAPLWNRLLQELEDAELVRSRGHKVLLSEASETIDQAEGPLLRRLLEIYIRTGFQSPRPDELPGMLGEPEARIKRLLEYLINEGRLISVSKHVILSAQSLRQAQSRVVAVIQERGVLNSADFKYEIHSSRKYALAILDWLDARHVTLRIGNDRKLAPDYQNHLL